MNTFGGYSVVINDSTHPVPNRTLPWLPWHGGRAYHARVQKKWNRRYGTHPEMNLPDGQVVTSNETGVIVMNSKTWQQTKAAIACAGTAP